MDSSDHHRKAEELAAKAEKYLGQGDGQESAAVWAAVAQVHATLALAAPATVKDAPAAHDIDSPHQQAAGPAGQDKLRDQTELPGRYEQLAAAREEPIAQADRDNGSKLREVKT